MKLQNFSYRTQIFLASLILLVIPSTLLGITTANQTASSVRKEFNQTMETIINQSNLTLDTLLRDATKIADMHILNNDIRKALLTDYKNDLLSYSQDNYMIAKQLTQTNRLNTNVLSCLFRSRYNYTFEYNITSATLQKEILEKMNSWETFARSSNYYTYFAPIQKSFAYNKTILPMVKILYDGYTFKELGSCYVGIDFSQVENIFNSAKTTNNVFLIYNSNNDLIYCSNQNYLNSNKYEDLLKELSDFSANFDENSSNATRTISIQKNSYLVNGCYNKTTGWNLIQFTNNQNISKAYQHNLANYFYIFIVTLLLGLILAVFLSRGLTDSIHMLCKKIDSHTTENFKDITVEGKISNRELQTLVNSFNHLNKHLVESLRQNYLSQINEQALRIQILQTQINHHFLYNTLNGIKSLADIHNEPEIKTIASCMSDLLRYNLKKVPIVCLEEEIQQLHRYITILNIRFPNKFSFDCTIPKEFYSLKIPAFLLQPLVENCVEHGFVKMDSGCYINVSANINDNTLHFLVADNGAGISPKRLKELSAALLATTAIPNDINSSPAPKGNHHFIGILNVHQRIKSYYGDNYGLSIESCINEGTIIDIKIPYNQKPKLPQQLH